MLSGRDAHRAVPGANMERLPSLADGLSTFLEDKAASSRAVTGGYVVSLRQHLADFLQDDRPCFAFDEPLCRELLRSRLNLAPSTRKTHWAALSAFGAWLCDRGYIPANPLKRIPAPRVPERPHRYLSALELRTLYAAAGRSRKKPAELQCLLLLLFEGLRAFELCSLRWQDVRDDRIVVAFGKGGKVRAIPLRPAVRKALAGLKSSDGRIFTLTVNGLENRLRRLSRRAGVPGVHPHLFRHSFASHSLVAGLDPQTIAVVGGWQSDSKMMARYTASVREDAAIKRSLELGVSDKIFE